MPRKKPTKERERRIEPDGDVWLERLPPNPPLRRKGERPRDTVVRLILEQMPGLDLEPEDLKQVPFPGSRSDLDPTWTAQGRRAPYLDSDDPAQVHPWLKFKKPSDSFEVAFGSSLRECAIWGVTLELKYWVNVFSARDSFISERRTRARILHRHLFPFNRREVRNARRGRF